MKNICSPLTRCRFHREADRVILTTCQQEGANQSTFQSISTLLGNKTSSEVIGCLFFCDWSFLLCMTEAPSGVLVSAGVSEVSGFDAFVSDSCSSNQL